MCELISHVLGEHEVASAHSIADALRRATAQRRRLMALRDEGTIGDAAFQRIEEELDWAELGWAQVLRSGRGAVGES